MGNIVVNNQNKAYLVNGMALEVANSNNYVRLSYLGSPQYASTDYAVNTGLTLTQDNIYGKIVYAYSGTSGTDYPNTTHTVIGARGPGWVGGFIMYPSRFCMAEVDLRTGVSIPSYRSSFTTASFSNENGVVTISVKVGNQSPTTQSTSVTTSGNTGGTPVTLFALRIVDEIRDAGGFVIQEIELYDGSRSNQVAYIYPARTPDSSQYGFYDEIRDLFIPVTGTGWVIGPDA